jgi:hypothetical protein
MFSSNMMCRTILFMKICGPEKEWQGAVRVTTALFQGGALVLLSSSNSRGGDGDLDTGLRRRWCRPWHGGCGNDDGDLDKGLWRWQWWPWHAAAAMATMTLHGAAATMMPTSARGCGDDYLGTGLRRRWCLDIGLGDENNADLDTGLWPALY